MKIWSIDWTGFSWKVWFDRTDEIPDPDEYTVSGDFLLIFFFGVCITLSFNTEKKQDKAMEIINFLEPTANKVWIKVINDLLIKYENYPEDALFIPAKSIDVIKKELKLSYEETDDMHKFNVLEYAKTIYWDLKKQKYYIKRRK